MRAAPKQCMIILMKFKNCFMNHQVLKKMEARVKKTPTLFLGNSMIYVNCMKYYMVIYLKNGRSSKDCQVLKFSSIVLNLLAVAINLCFFAALCFK